MTVSLPLLLAPLLLPDWLDPEFIIMSLGNWALWGVALIVFAECGLFSLLPGDSLLFTVGMFVALGTITFGDLSSGWVLAICCLVLTIAAVLGNISGYYLGRLIGPPLFKPRSGFMGKVFNPKYVEMTHGFFEKYGSRALILARFVPMVRTFVTLVAGVGKMEFRKFITYTAIGGVLWATGVTVLGYFLGTIPIVHQNIEVALVLIVLVSLVPMGVEYVMAKRRGKAEAAAVTFAEAE
ncbi:DedA family protein [Propionicicella superfundia]|uniref:DedA family protein n=1 Tax=Propionicicella superfundia TaxID=348582 RepID=UPI00056D369E|nr:VTT domain-containing protein [Propionicicella superfundia]